MRTGMNVRPSARQRGWVGLIVILVALVIVAILAKDALKKYGLAPGAPVTTKAGTPAERARAPGAGGIETAINIGEKRYYELLIEILK